MRTVEEIKKMDENIVLLDAPSFFELLRIYLNDESQSPFSGGNGTENAPYLVATPEQFDAVRGYKDKCFKLIADLDFTGYDYKNKEGWWPLGEWGSGDKDAARFSGVFDGDFHKIKNLKAERKAHDLSLFGVTDGADIKNLIVEGCEITGEGRLGIVSGATFRTNLSQVAVVNSNCYNTLSDHGSQAGGITGPLNNSTLLNCYSIGGVVYAKDGVGGIASFCHSGSRLYNCYSTCRIEGSMNTGGITGGSDNATIESCIALNKSIVGKMSDYGRIAGSVHGGAICTNNYSYESVTVNEGVVTENLGPNTINGENANQKETTSIGFYQDKLLFNTDIWKLDPAIFPYPVFKDQTEIPTSIRNISGDIKKKHLLKSTAEGVIVENLNGEELISVYSLSGVLMRQQIAKSYSEKVILEIPGTYILRISSDHGAVSYKFIK
jgi:hypothetical protein